MSGYYLNKMLKTGYRKGYGKTYRRGRTYYGNTKKRGGPLTLAQVKAVEKIRDKGMPKKYKDTISNNIDCDSTPVVTKIPMPAQGSTDDDRLGDRIRVSSVRCHLYTRFTNTNSAHRFIVFQWLVDDGTTTPTAADIFEDTSKPLNSMYNVNGSSKYRILLDKRYANTSGVASSSKLHQYLLRPAVAKVRFNEGATTGYGHFYIMSMGNSIDNEDDYDLQSRIRYYDA